jgi:hypothetical protein
MGPERPAAVIMAVLAIWVGAARWVLGRELTCWELTVRILAAVFALVCLWGAVELWRMGRER